MFGLKQPLPRMSANNANRHMILNGGLNSPTGVAAGNDWLYVSDQGNSRVLVYQLPVPSLAAVQASRRPYPAAYVLGQSSFTAPAAAYAEIFLFCLEQQAVREGRN